MMLAKGLYYDPTLVRYTEPYMDDVDEKATGGKFRIIPIFEKAAYHGRGHEGDSGNGGQRSGWFDLAHGTQAPEFEALVKQAGLTPARAIQSGTMVNATALGWQDRIGSVDKGKYADLVAVSGDPTADITERRE